MRPIKLTMTAFGPYKNTEVIDFKELKDHHLFVISGNTGSGKTTIFDGICFALYGTASGQDRDNYAMLRSDFADDDVHTSVEFTFELNGRFYRILRQLGHVKQGNKSKTGERYEFYEQTEHGEVPCVERQIVTEINQKVEELIGLTQDQFKQIVMLPQGEFRRLLTSQTENKEEILRRLFKTEPYQQISERLKEKRNDLEKDFLTAKQQLDTHIQNIHATLPNHKHSTIFNVLGEEHYNIKQVIDGLQEEINFYEQKIIIDQKKYHDAYQAHDQKQTEYHQAKTINERFMELENKEEQLKQLQAKESLFKEKEKQLAMAEKASKIEPYETQMNEWRKEEERREKNLHQATKLKKISDDKLTKVTMIYEQEKSKKDEREKVSTTLERLKQFLPTVQDINANKKALEQQKSTVIKTREELRKIQTAYNENNQQIKQYEQKIKSLEKETDELQHHQEALINMREKYIVLKDYLTFVHAKKQLSEELKIQQAAYEQMKYQYEKIEQLYFSNQASFLASHLQDGDACPVCGSLEHPHKATAHESSMRPEELEDAKKLLTQKETSYRNTLANYQANEKQLKSKEKEVIKHQIPIEQAEVSFKKLEEQGIQLKAKVDKLKTSSQKLSSFRQTYEQVKKDYEMLEERKETIEKQYQNEKSTYEKNEAVFQERLRTIPEEVRVLSVLEQKIRETEKLKLALESAWENAQKNLQSTKEEHTKTSAHVEHAKKQLAETKAKRKDAELKFKDALQQANFDSEQAYVKAKISADDRERLTLEIEQFKQNISTLTKQIKELKLVLKDQKQINLSAITKELEQLKEAYESALKTLNLSKDYYEEATQIKTKIMDTNENVKVYEKQLATVTDLYDVIRGQNSKKISFERYLQIEYLEQIIDAANQRLKNLSNGQFLLMRSDRTESHGRQSGLALDVYDSYTGLTRDVKTLSGGEKFNAALCLALGMSDVIQSFQGNISIQMMFIDEGFGSLDEESLNKAIDTLIDLQQSGRMIGVISHVQELKTIFPAVLEVKKTNEGHSETKFVLK